MDGHNVVQELGTAACMQNTPSTTDTQAPFLVLPNTSQSRRAQ